MDNLNTILTDAHILVIARKKALTYSYANEYQYDMFVKAIAEGMIFTRDYIIKHINQAK